MDLLLALSAVLMLTIASNLVEKNGSLLATKRFAWLLAILNSPIVAVGLALIFLPVETYSILLDASVPIKDPTTLGLILMATGVWGISSCNTSFRVYLAKFTALDAGSPVQMTALILAGYLVGNTALALSQEFLLELSASDLAVSAYDIVLQQAAFVMLAYVGAGLVTRRSFADVSRRLGLVKPTWQQLIMGVVVISSLIFLQAALGGIWALFYPEQAEQLGTTNEALLTGFDTVGEWFVLALASGFGEEILFRGALQPVFGIPLTSLLFAVVHIQYGLTPITVVVFLLGIVLGLVRRFSNTTVAIFVHFGYNFSLGLLSLLALYLEQVVVS